MLNFDAICFPSIMSLSVSFPELAPFYGDRIENVVNECFLEVN